MATATKARKLSDQDLAELIALTKGADSVEPQADGAGLRPSRGAAALGVDPRRSDSAGLLLRHAGADAQRAGVVVRARRVQGKGDDTVVKLRPVVPKELPAELRRSPNFGVEVDAMPGGFVCSGSMKRAEDSRRPGRGVGGAGRSASSTPRSSGRCTPRTHPRARAGRSLDPRPDLRAQAEVRARGLTASSSPAPGSTRTTR